MAKLVYIANDDAQLFDILLTALKENGYNAEYTTSKEIPAADRIHADLAIVLRNGSQPNTLTVGNVTLDIDSIRAYDQSGTLIHLTPIEFAMLAYLMKNAHRAVPRAELIPAVWGYTETGRTRVADDTAKRLRRKLAGSTLVLETVWNYGFRVRAK